MVSISDPAAIVKVYPMRPGFPKVCRSLSYSSLTTCVQELFARSFVRKS